MYYPSLNPDKALIWRVTHYDNMPWILQNGLQAAYGRLRCPTWKVIGSQDLIVRRGSRKVPLAPYGVLNDYVPFYFTPFSPMMYNIYAGRGGVEKVPNQDVIILVSSLHKVADLGLKFVFTDRHAYTCMAKFYNDLAELQKIDWGLLQRRDFKRKPDDPGAIERYQAEALVHSHIPLQGLKGAICYSEHVQQQLQGMAEQLGQTLPFHCRPNWYFKSTA